LKNLEAMLEHGQNHRFSWIIFDEIFPWILPWNRPGNPEKKLGESRIQESSKNPWKASKNSRGIFKNRQRILKIVSKMVKNSKESSNQLEEIPYIFQESSKNP